MKKFDDDQRLVWLLHSSATPDAYFAGVNATALPKEIWSTYPALADELSKLPETSQVERGLIERTARPILGVCGIAAQGIGPAERCVTGAFDERAYAISAAQSSAGWRIDYSDIGVRRFAHYIEAADVDRSGCNPSLVICNLYKGSYRVQVNEKIFELPRRGGGFIFDTDKQVLLHVIFGIVSSTRKK